MQDDTGAVLSIPSERELSGSRAAAWEASLVRELARSGSDSRSPRRRVWYVLAAAAVLIAIAVSPAFGLGGKVFDLFSLRDSDEPVGVWSLPGDPTEVSPLVVTVARASGVDPTSVREIASAESARGRVVLLAGLGRDDRVWLTRVMWRGSPPFDPSRPSGVGQFHPLAPAPPGATSIIPEKPDGAVIFFDDGIGALVGFTRSDVERVEATLANGDERELALNAWRGFGYAAGSADEAAAELRAFDKDGELVDSREIHTAPPAVP
jgi:hypothetical protein